MRVVLQLVTAVLVASSIVGPAALAAQTKFSARVVGVVDGDSLEVRRGGSAVQVRLYGIDCPEWGQPQGPEAARAARALAGGRMVTVRVHESDDYGRLIAEVQLPDGRSLNRELVRIGYAWWYRRYSVDAELERLEIGARIARRGLWGDPDPMPPWLWRREHPRKNR